jgi:hypothetical protein
MVVLNSVNLLGPPQASVAFPACTLAYRGKLGRKVMALTRACHVTIGICGGSSTILEGVATEALLTILGTRVIVALADAELDALRVGQRGARVCAACERALSRRVTAHYELTADNSRSSGRIGPTCSIRCRSNWPKGMQGARGTARSLERAAG